jgi:LytS/YehU family sensor histidine kinase
LFEWYFIVYWAIVLFTYAFDFYNRYRKKELQTLQLEKRLIQAQLQTLKMQLHPHFLFNTLNTVSSLVRQEQKGTAISMLSGLSSLLRLSLAQRDRQEVSLQEEIQFIKHYLNLEKERFGEGMQIHYELEATALEVAVPAFLLQPLVENAVYHGLAKKLDARRLEISAKVINEHLQLQIYNDGPPIEDDFDPVYCNGIGLSNTLERLSQYYDGKFEFEIKNCRNGVMINMQLPTQNQDNG